MFFLLTLESNLQFKRQEHRLFYTKIVFKVQKVFALFKVNLVLGGLYVILGLRHGLESGAADLKHEFLSVVDFNYKIVVFLDELIKCLLIIKAKVSN